MRRHPSFYEGARVQRGHGLGALFMRTLMPATRKIFPLVGKVLGKFFRSDVGQKTVSSGLNLMHDVSRGEKMKVASKRRFQELAGYTANHYMFPPQQGGAMNTDNTTWPQPPKIRKKKGKGRVADKRKMWKYSTKVNKIANNVAKKATKKKRAWQQKLDIIKAIRVANRPKKKKKSSTGNKKRKMSVPLF